MQQGLSELLITLLDKTDSLGVGCIDTNGLVIESQGEHAGRNPHELACYLSHCRPTRIEEHLGDVISEHIILGVENHLYLRWLPNNHYMLYVMTHPRARGGVTRHALYSQAKKLYMLMQKRESGQTLGERLEQPRKFMNLPSVGPKIGSSRERVFQKL